LCMVSGDTIYDEYVGLDYSVALDLHLYFYTVRDILTWAMSNGYKWYSTSGQNYDPKFHLRCELVPLDLYVTHTSKLANLVLRRGADSAAVTSGAVGLFGIAALASVWTWLGIVSKVLCLVSWLYVLRFVPLSVAYPLNNVVNVLVPLGAHLFLHEHVPVGRWV